MSETRAIDPLDAIVPKGDLKGMTLRDVFDTAEREDWVRWALCRSDDFWPDEFRESLHAAARREPTLQKDARREEVRRRWYRRGALRQFEQRYIASVLRDGVDVALDEILDDIFHYGQWASHADLLAVLDTQTRLDMTLRLLRVVELKEMPYDEYLRTDHWRELAARIKADYGGACALDTRHLAVDAHHRTYERRGRERLSDLIPLCRDCHAKFHDKR